MCPVEITVSIPYNKNPGLIITRGCLSTLKLIFRNLF